MLCRSTKEAGKGRVFRLNRIPDPSAILEWEWNINEKIYQQTSFCKLLMGEGRHQNIGAVDKI